MCGRVIGLGAGGHAKVVIDILRQMPGLQIVGLLDPDKNLWGSFVLGIPILGGDDSLDVYADGFDAVFIGVGSTGYPRLRRELFRQVAAKGLPLVSALHPRSTIAASVTLGQGIAVMAAAVLNPDARLGHNVIVNTAAVIEHDCVLGNHVHIAPSATLAGDVHIGDCTHVGAGATILQGRKIGVNSIIGAGAVVIDDIPDSVVAVGIPARCIGPNRSASAGGETLL